jgi:actin-related protein 8
MTGPKCLSLVSIPCAFAQRCLSVFHPRIDITTATDDVEAVSAEGKGEETKSTPTPSKAATNGDGTVDAPMEIVDIDEVDIESKPAAEAPTAAQVQVATQQPTQQPSGYSGGYGIDVCFEASKLPLDVAIFNSARAAGGDEKIRKYLQGVLVVGGCALVPGMAHALESR